MQTDRGFEIHIGQIGPDRFLAATSASPYFCFEAESKEAVTEKVRRALRFYYGHRGTTELRIPMAQTFRPFSTTAVIRIAELADVA